MEIKKNSITLVCTEAPHCLSATFETDAQGHLALCVDIDGNPDAAGLTLSAEDLERLGLMIREAREELEGGWLRMRLCCIEHGYYDPDRYSNHDSRGCPKCKSDTVPAVHPALLEEDDVQEDAAC